MCDIATEGFYLPPSVVSFRFPHRTVCSFRVEARYEHIGPLIALIVHSDKLQFSGEIVCNQLKAKTLPVR